jgi:stage III sporulation protein SpoIIIAA
MCGTFKWLSHPRSFSFQLLGKTTIVREATRLLAAERHVLVVDTSNEIAGDGMVPHQCIGLARRMMVPSLDEQSAVMVECVQNHTPVSF